ncbi:MAG: hypothetical protein ACJAS3_000332 [Roseivirga sp.]|jgi:hypothetical protein
MTAANTNLLTNLDSKDQQTYCTLKRVVNMILADNVKISYVYSMRFNNKTNAVLTIILSISLLFSSCTNDDDQKSTRSSLEKISVLSVSDIGISKLSKLVDNISYTALKGHQDHRAYRIDKVLIEAGRLYIFDYFSGRSLSVYDLNGNFQFSITKPGNGPDQYLEIQDFLIDNGRIRVLDAFGRVIFYDEQGVFEKSEKLPFSAQAFTKVDNSYIFQTGKRPNILGQNGKSCELAQYDLETKKIDCVLEINSGRKQHSSIERNVLKRIGEDYYYGTYYNDTIYKRRNKRFVLDIVLNFGPNAFPEEIFDPSLSFDEFVDYRNNNKTRAYHKTDLNGTSDIMITLYFANGNNHLIHDKREKTTAIVKSTAQNNVDGSLPLYWVHSINDRDIIMIIDSQYVLERSYQLKEEKTQFSEKEQAFLDFASRLSIDDPLVMIQYHLK